MTVTGRGVLLAAHQSVAVGGIGTVAKGLATHVPPVLGDSIPITVAAPTANGGALGSLGGRGAAARFWYEQVHLGRRARAFDLLHLCDLRPVWASSTPFIVTVHDLDFLDQPGSYPRVTRSYKALMLRAAIRKRPAAIICHSDYVRRGVLAHFPRLEAGRVRVIRPGVCTPAGLWTGAGDPPYFLTVSTISPRKNHLGLLDAYRSARERGLGLTWVVAGPAGSGSSSILHRLRSEPGVRVIGQVDARQLDALYREAVFVATPSAAEGFGYPPLEAMVRGTPTLSSDGGALPELIGDAGPILPADDRQAWAGALTWLARDSRARDELSARGRRRARAFSWDRAAAEVADLYREVLLGDRVSPAR